MQIIDQQVQARWYVSKNSPRRRVTLKNFANTKLMEPGILISEIENNQFYTGQTITAFKRTISQYCWAQHVGRVLPPC